MLYLCGVNAAEAKDKELGTSIVSLTQYRLDIRLTNRYIMGKLMFFSISSFRCFQLMRRKTDGTSI